MVPTAHEGARPRDVRALGAREREPTPSIVRDTDGHASASAFRDAPYVDGDRVSDVLLHQVIRRSSSACSRLNRTASQSTAKKRAVSIGFRLFFSEEHKAGTLEIVKRPRKTSFYLGQ